MNRVYIVQHDDCEYQEIYAVFSTLNLAKEHIRDNYPEWARQNIKITEWEILDKPADNDDPFYSGYPVSKILGEEIK